jgi:hypothetical protein
VSNLVGEQQLFIYKKRGRKPSLFSFNGGVFWRALEPTSKIFQMAEPNVSEAQISD